MIYSTVFLLPQMLQNMQPEGAKMLIHILLFVLLKLVELSVIIFVPFVLGEWLNKKVNDVVASPEERYRDYSWQVLCTIWVIGFCIIVGSGLGLFCITNLIYGAILLNWQWAGALLQ